MMTYEQTLDMLRDNGNFTLTNAYQKAVNELFEHSNIMLSISGGADSDVMLDLMLKANEVAKKEMHFVFFDTGLEYQATKDHISELEQKYGIEIERVKPKKPIPVAVKEYGLPFVSKFVSEFIEALQKANFDFEYNNKNCNTSYEKWWNNVDTFKQFRIDRNKGLKEFLSQNKPPFKISAKCCKYCKKQVSGDYEKANDIDMVCLGIRNAEGGIRAAAYESCFDYVENGADRFRPIFYFTNKDKEDYCKLFGVTHSRCYTEYGMKRTGCAGCPFNRNIEKDLQIIKQYEPKLYKACINIFGESYEYTRQYREFQRKMNLHGQVEMEL